MKKKYQTPTADSVDFEMLPIMGDGVSLEVGGSVPEDSDGGYEEEGMIGTHVGGSWNDIWGN